MSNEDARADAEKCIEIAQHHLSEGNFDKAERLALKAQRFFPDDRTTQLLNRIRAEKEFHEKSKDKLSMYTAKGNSCNNIEDAERSIELAQTFIFEQKFDKARRMLNKAERLYPSARAKDLLRQIDDKGDSQDFLNTVNRNPKPVVVTPVVKKRETSAEQLQAMARVRNAKSTDSYEILGLPRQCDYKQVKKTYRQLTLLLHPDKNKEPEAKEIFMKVIGAMEHLCKEKKKQ